MNEQDFLDHITQAEDWTTDQQSRSHTWPIRDFHSATITEVGAERTYTIHNGMVDSNEDWASVEYLKTDSFDVFWSAVQEIRNMRQDQYETTF